MRHFFAGYASPYRLSSHIPNCIASIHFRRILIFFSPELRKKQARLGWVPIFRSHFILFILFLVEIIALEPSFNNV